MRLPDLSRTLGTTTLTELVVLVGYYRTLAQLMDAYDVGVTPPSEPRPADRAGRPGSA